MKELSKIIFYALIINISYITCSRYATNKDLKFKWQAHSWDDLRQWRQLFQKGTINFKIDMHYLSHEQCANQTAQAKDSPLGCFVLLHDAVITTNKYFTQYDVAEYLISNQPLYQQHNTTIYIALCFKFTNANPCSNIDENALNFVSLVDQLYALFQEEVVEKLNLDVQFILDGDAVKSSCFKTKWPKWIYTWIGTSDPQEALYSNDPELGYDRFAIFNDEIYYIEKDALANWGKFQNMSYPLQVWEPSQQFLIQGMAKIFNDHSHKSGYEYAINIDPMQYSVYVGSESNETLNQHLKKYASSPKLVVVPYNNSSWKNQQITVIAFYNKNKQFISQSQSLSQSANTCFTIYSYQFQKPILRDHSAEETCFQVNPLDESDQLSSVSSFSCTEREVKQKLCHKNNLNESYILLTSQKGYYALYSFMQNQTLRLLSQQAYPSLFQMDPIQMGMAGKAASCISHITKQGHLVVYLAASTPSSLLVYALELNLRQTAGALLENHFLALEWPDSLLTQVESIAITKRSGIIEGVVSYVTSDSTIKGCYIQGVYYNKKQGSKKQSRLQLDCKQSFVFGVGTQSSVSIIQKNNKLNMTKTYFIETHSGGYCFNNELYNKNATSLLCNRLPQPTPYILNYNYGELSMFQFQNNNNSANSSELFLGPCLDSEYEFVSGTYDMGVNSHVVLYPFQENNLYAEEIIIPIELHEGVPSDTNFADKENQFVCGLSIPFDGIVADSFRVPQQFI